MRYSGFVCVITGVMKRRVARSSNASGGVGGGNSGSGSGAHRAGEFLRNAAATVHNRTAAEYYPSYVQPKHPTSPSTYTSQ